MSDAIPKLEDQPEFLKAENIRLNFDLATLKVSNEKLTADIAVMTAKMADFDKEVARSLVQFGIVSSPSAVGAAKPNRKTLDDQQAELAKANPATVVPPFRK